MTGNIRKIAALSAVAVVATSHAAMAGSFALKERSTRAQGLSFAGASAGSGGLSSMGFNPAAIGLVRDGAEVMSGFSIIDPIADGVVTTGGIPTGETVDPTRTAFLTNGYVGYRMEPDITIGLAAYVPFGLTTQYDQGFAGAGDGLTSKLFTLVIAPTVGYEPFPGLTLALSGNITRAEARLTSSDVNLDGDQTTLSFGVGALWEVSDSTTVGLAYQHGYDLSLVGSADVAAFGATFPVRADASLPSTVSAGIIQDVTDDLRVMGEVQWQNWSVFDQIDVSINSGAPVADPQNYDDAFFVAVGAEYDLFPDTQLRVGAAWDQTPTVDSDFLTGGTTLGRTVRVPDDDRVWLSFGATWKVNDHMEIDFGYSYLFGLDDPVVDLRTAPGTSVTYSAGAHIFSLGSTMRF